MSKESTPTHYVCRSFLHRRGSLNWLKHPQMGTFFPAQTVSVLSDMSKDSSALTHMDAPPD
jgi:hypothetical protein